MKVDFISRYKSSTWHKVIAVVFLLVGLLVVYDAEWSAEGYGPDSDYWHSTRLLAGTEEFISRSAAELEQRPQHQLAHNSDLTVCGRQAYPALNLTSEQYQQFSSCPTQKFDPSNPIMVLEGRGRGRTGNLLREFLRAVQYAHDHDYTLGVIWNSWAMDLLLPFFLVDMRGAAELENQGYIRGRVRSAEVEEQPFWIHRIEKVLCLKILGSVDDVKGWDRVKVMAAIDLFGYESPAPLGDQMALTQYTLRRLFEHPNTASSTLRRGQSFLTVTDMCAGINSVLSPDMIDEGNHQPEDPKTTKYSVIHLRYLEGEPGKRILAHESSVTGCDPQAALEMEPEYIKSILEESCMLRNQVVVITDGQNVHALERLMSDPDIGPNMRVVDPDASTLGADITLATMATVFIGNPASTLSKFIAQARISLGMGNNFIYRARDGLNSGQWKTVCGVDCLWRRN